jgi:hypothetical protein
MGISILARAVRLHQTDILRLVEDFLLSRVQLKPHSVHRHPQSLSLSTQPPRQTPYQRSHPASIDRV